MWKCGSRHTRTTGVSPPRSGRSRTLRIGPSVRPPFSKHFKIRWMLIFQILKCFFVPQKAKPTLCGGRSSWNQAELEGASGKRSLARAGSLKCEPDTGVITTVLATHVPPPPCSVSMTMLCQPFQAAVVLIVDQVVSICAERISCRPNGHGC